MVGRYVSVTDVFTTPKQLRELADKMDAEIAKCRLGDQLPVLTIYLQPDEELRIKVDQDALSKERLDVVRASDRPK